VGKNHTTKKTNNNEKSADIKTMDDGTIDGGGSGTIHILYAKHNLRV
jgi:hypothetical protein